MAALLREAGALHAVRHLAHWPAPAVVAHVWLVVDELRGAGVSLAAQAVHSPQGLALAVGLVPVSRPAGNAQHQAG